ncbi:hypothetical protein PGT21_003036, partial [Puccinia graminis f. sp. tritici]
MRFSLSHNVSTRKSMTPKWAVGFLLFAAVSHSAENLTLQLPRSNKASTFRASTLSAKTLLFNCQGPTKPHPSEPQHYHSASLIGRPIHFKGLRLGHCFPPPRESTITGRQLFSTPARIDENSSAIVFHPREPRKKFADRFGTARSDLNRARRPFWNGPIHLNRARRPFWNGPIHLNRARRPFWNGPIHLNRASKKARRPFWNRPIRFKP